MVRRFGLLLFCGTRRGKGAQGVGDHREVSPRQIAETGLSLQKAKPIRVERDGSSYAAQDGYKFRVEADRFPKIAISTLKSIRIELLKIVKVSNYLNNARLCINIR